MSIQTSPEQALSKFDETDLAEFQRLKMTSKGDERAAVQDFITGLEGDIESARKQLMDMGYDVGLPARQEGAISGLPQVSGTYPPLETTSAPSAAPVLGAISAPDGAVATAVTNKPASQRFWETRGLVGPRRLTTIHCRIGRPHRECLEAIGRPRVRSRPNTP